MLIAIRYVLAYRVNSGSFRVRESLSLRDLHCRSWVIKKQDSCRGQIDVGTNQMESWTRDQAKKSSHGSTLEGPAAQFRGKRSPMQRPRRIMAPGWSVSSSRRCTRRFSEPRLHSMQSARCLCGHSCLQTRFRVTADVIQV